MNGADGIEAGGARLNRYLVMRRTMTGSWEDCIEAFEPRPIAADSAEQAQERVGDGLGVYRVIDLGPPNVEGPVTHVVVEHTISRSTVAQPPPLEPDEVASPDARAELARGVAQVQGRQLSVAEAPA